MPRKRSSAPSEPSSSTPKSRVTRRSTASTAPPSKRKPYQEPESDPESEEEEDEDEEPQPSTSKKSTRGQATRGKNTNKKKPKDSDDDEDDDEEKEEVSREETPTPVKKSNKAAVSKKKKKKNDSPPDTPSTSRTPSPSPEPEPSTPAPKSAKKGGKATSSKKKPEPPKPVPRVPKRKKQEEEEEETPEEKKLRRRAERKARRILEAKSRPKLTLAEKLEKLRKKKERRERRRQSEKEEAIRQKYGQRKMKPTESRWNFGPISCINQRRRDEMMAFFPKASFQETEDGKPMIMNNFRKATVKYNMEILNPFITCGICDGYLVDATTIIDCMHTFCKSCLLGYFHSDNTSCPTCGTFIHGSHPSHYVTYDRAVNELVNQLVPNLEFEELESRKRFLRDCREALGIDTAAEDREKRERLELERRTGTNRCYGQEPARYSHHRNDCQVPVKLLPGTPNLPLVCRPFIICSEMTTMNTLKKYLALQLWDDQNRYSELDMFCDGQLMGKDFSIRFVWMMKRRGQPKAEPLIIRYHMIKN